MWKSVKKRNTNTKKLENLRIQNILITVVHSGNESACKSSVLLGQKMSANNMALNCADYTDEHVMVAVAICFKHPYV
jgi:hypothetical protein